MFSDLLSASYDSTRISNLIDNNNNNNNNNICKSQLSERILSGYNNKILNDVKFIISSELIEFDCHKFILSLSCKKFLF